jgi:hypothetical protein
MLQTTPRTKTLVIEEEKEQIENSDMLLANNERKRSDRSQQGYPLKFLSIGSNDSDTEEKSPDPLMK